MTRPLVVVGDLLLDRDVTGTADRLCPDAPVPVVVERDRVDRPGGAGLAATMLSRQADVTVVGALGGDAAGDLLRELLGGTDLVELPYSGRTPEKIRIRAGSHQLLRLDRNDTPAEPVEPTAAALDAIAAARAVLVSDYGRGVTAVPGIRHALARAAKRIPVIWDPHPRGAVPVAGSRLVCPNRAEAAHFAARTATGRITEVAAEAELLREAWDVTAVAVTLGARGALLCDGDHPPLTVPAPMAGDGDTCGAGDRFASAALLALADGHTLRQAVHAAVDAASRYVATGGPAVQARHLTSVRTEGYGS